MQDLKILGINEIISTGLEFDGENVFYGGEYGQQVCCKTTDNDESVYTGIIYEKYENGNLQYYSFYKNGLPDGVTVSYYENGNIKEYSNMYRGGQHGICKAWYEDGSIKSCSQSKYSFDLYYVEWDKKGEIIKEVKEPTDFAKRMIDKYDYLEK